MISYDFFRKYDDFLWFLLKISWFTIDFQSKNDDFRLKDDCFVLKRADFALKTRWIAANIWCVCTEYRWCGYCCKFTSAPFTMWFESDTFLRVCVCLFATLSSKLTHLSLNFCPNLKRLYTKSGAAALTRQWRMTRVCFHTENNNNKMIVY